MNKNYIFRDASTALPRLLAVLAEADEVGSRAGRVKELMHTGITLTQPWRREILVPHRKPNIAAQIYETMWVLSGRDDMEGLLRYLPRAADFSDDGKTWRAGYGKRLRSWEPNTHLDEPVDQLAYIVDLLKRDPLSRQAVMSIWDPAVDTEPGKDIPCNNWLSFSSRLGYLDLHVAIRSNDVIWGWSGINAFEWSALQEIVAGLLGIKVGSLHFSTTSFHLYDKHWAKADKIVSAATHPFYATGLEDSPRFEPESDTLDYFDELAKKWFRVEAMIRTGNRFVDEAVNTFPEPMLQSWLRILQWWWTGDEGALAPLEGTRLAASALYSVQPPERESFDQIAGTEVVSTIVAETPKVGAGASAFAEHAFKLHNQKHESYGDSWKRRGEMLGIMANIARKIDRLGKSDTPDENAADTALDLMVYLAKYRTWLHDFAGADLEGTTSRNLSDHTTWANSLIYDVDRDHHSFSLVDRKALEDGLRSAFAYLETFVVNDNRRRHRLVEEMLVQAYRLARSLHGVEHGHAARNATRGFNYESVASPK